MIVGYVSNLNLSGINHRYKSKIDELVNKSKEESLDYLILAGGISDDYTVSLSFISDLAKALSFVGTKLRFIVGNTDLYYKDEVVVNKVGKVNEIILKYVNSPYSLYNNPILTRSIRVVGVFSWYDYTMYRGKDITLKKVTKKKKLLYKNRDNVYITDSEDYVQGVNNTYDVTYSKKCVREATDKLEGYLQKHGNVEHNVVVTYFKPNRVLLRNGILSKYRGTFEGSISMHNVLTRNGVNMCIVGSKCNKRYININGLRYINPNSEVEVIRYD